MCIFIIHTYIYTVVQIQKWYFSRNRHFFFLNNWMQTFNIILVVFSGVGGLNRGLKKTLVFSLHVFV